MPICFALVGDVLYTPIDEAEFMEQNRRLLAIIRDRKPQSVAALAEMAGRSQPNLTRTLAKLEAAGFITMQAHGRRKAPRPAVRKIVVEIDPYSDRDRLRVA